MALTYPLALATFLDALRIEEITFSLSGGVELKTLGSGEIITAQHGVRLWQGTVTLEHSNEASHEDAMALVRALGAPGASFLMTPVHYKRTTATNGTLNAVQNGNQMRIAGIGAGAVIPRGAFLQMLTGGVYHFHQTVEAVTADGTGLTPYVQVVPPIRPGYSIGQTVRLSAPHLKAVLVPGSVRDATIRSTRADGVAFDWRQSLRA